jgi:thiamine pyrophosphokinase
VITPGRSTFQGTGTQAIDTQGIDAQDIDPQGIDTVVVVAGGDAPALDTLAGVPAGAFVVAADGGATHAQALGLRVDVAVGDFDSAPPAVLDRVTAAGGRVERHPATKNQTDLELALDVAVARRPAKIVVIGGHGGRFDHWLGNAFLLAAPAYAAVELTARMGAAVVTVVRAGRPATLAGVPGTLVSLLPVHGTAAGVRTAGLRYPLSDEDLPAGTTRGVSNVLVASPATVTLRAGVLLAVQPGG